MANPFDQFDSTPGAAPTTVPQPARIKPGETPDAVAAAQGAQPGAVATPAPGEPLPAGPAPGGTPNPFDDLSAPLAATAPVGISNDEFSGQFYDKLNAGESPEAIIQWSKEVGHQIIPDENFYTNVRIRDEALRNGGKGKYGRVNATEAGEAPPTDVLGGAGAFLRQGGNTMLFNFGDEIESAVRAVPEWMQGKGFEQAYEDRHADLQSRNNLDWTVHPGMSLAGTATGALLSAKITPSIMNVGKVRNAGLAARAAAGGAEGAAYGAVAATGEGTPQDRFRDTGAGAVIGGGIGAAVSPAMAAIGRLGRPVVERMFPNEVKALARRLNYSPDQIAAAEAELTRQQGLGITDSTLLDIIDEPGRTVVGTAGVHDSAREALQDVASARATQLPERVAGAADDIITPENARGMGVADEVRGGIADQRDFEIGQALDAPIGGGLTVRTAPISMTPEIADVLGTTNGLKAIRSVINSTADAAERTEYEGLLAAARQRARSTNPGLSLSAQQAAQGVQLSQMPFTIGMSERIGRELNNMGAQTGNNVLFSFGKTVRAGAEQSPAYRDAMARYGQMSDYAAAPGVGSGVSDVMDDAGKVTRVANEGRGLMGTETADRFGVRVNELGTDPMQDLAGNPLSMPGGLPAPSEVDLARLGATEQVATRAGRGPGEARGVAEQLYDSPEQMAKNRALLGTDAADRLAGRMREEVQRVFRAGKQATKEGPGKEAGMAAVESGVNMAYNPGPISFIRESARFLHRVGLSERDALWIVRNATDPAQTTAIINRLKKAGADETRARAYTDQLRDAAVRYFTSTEEN